MAIKSDMFRQHPTSINSFGYGRAYRAPALPNRNRFWTVLAFGALAACTAEKRTLSSEHPQTPPNGGHDPRADLYELNSYQVSQGGRYFTWCGCQTCHGDTATGVANLQDGQWRHGGGFDQIYRSIAQGPGMHAYAARIPVEQLWQITGYVRQLQSTKPNLVHRQALDQQGEPQAGTWSGPLR